MKIICSLIINDVFFFKFTFAVEHKDAISGQLYAIKLFNNTYCYRLRLSGHSDGKQWAALMRFSFRYQ